MSAHWFCVCGFWLLEILLVQAFKSTVFLAITMLALLMRTKGALWEKCWQKRTLNACSWAVCRLIPLTSIWWHSTRLVLRLCWSINLFFSVPELETNWVLVKGARLNSVFPWSASENAFPSYVSLGNYTWKNELTWSCYVRGCQAHAVTPCWQCLTLSANFNQICQKVEVPPSHPSTLLVSVSFVKELTLMHGC